MLALTTYSKAPIRLMTLSGVAISAMCVLAAFVYLALKLAFWNSFPIGIVPLVIGVFFLSSVNLLALGLVGEYVGLILQYSRRFPLVVERERINFGLTTSELNTSGRSIDPAEQGRHRA